MKKIRNLIYVMGLLIVALACFGFSTNLSNNITNAYSGNNVNFESINLTNSDFNSSPNSTTLDKNPSGWGKIKESSSATSGVINIGERFSSTSSTYQLENNQNPGKFNNAYDNKILMLNAKNSQGIASETSQGYKSNDIALEAYSFYEIRVLVYTELNSYASVYLTGFNNEITTNSFTNINTNGNWKEFTFFVQTNENSTTANLQLYLGATSERGSIGVVFFDNILVWEVSNARYASDVAGISGSTQSAIIKNDINYETDYQTSDYNFNFETGTTAGSWTIEGNFSATNTTARVVNLTDETLMQQYKLPNVGVDNVADSVYGLALSTSEKGYVGFVSNNSIKIDQFGLYKITLNVKTDNISGNAYIKLIENNDINLFYGEDIDFYVPTTQSIKISANSNDKLKNLYNTVSFYVSGHPLYDTSVKLGLFLGAEDDLSSGTAIFDNITIEKIGYDQFSTVTTNDLNKKATYTTISSTPSVDNGYFNSAINQTKDLQFPIAAEKWTQTTKENSDNNLWGIVNTNQNAWNKNQLMLANPRNPNINVNGTYIQTPITDTNNIFMAYNKSKSYQTLEGPKLTLSKDSYYTISFDFKSINFNADASKLLNIYLKDSNDKIIYEDFGVENSAWSNYKIILKTEYYSTDVKLVLEVGTKNLPAQGVVYIDNLTLATETFSNDEFLEIVNSEINNVVDLSNMGFNIKGDSANAFGVYDALMFEGKLEQGTQIEGSDELAFGGIIDEDNILGVEFPETNTNISKNMLVVSNRGAATYTLTSKHNIALSASSYYKFSVYIKTSLSGTPKEDADSTYGAQFKLSGLDGAAITKINSNEFAKYEIYAFIDKASTVNVKFGFVSDDNQSIGNAFFDNFEFETITESVYKAATESGNVLIFSTVDKSDSDKEEDKDDPNENKPDNSAQIWIAISTIIMTVAIILAIVLYFIRKIDFKKLESKKATPNVYDRNKTVVRDAVIKDAEKRRDEDIKIMQEEIKKLEVYLAELEEENKQRIEKNRKAHGKAITRQAEKEFKTYVSNRNRITKDIEKIEQQIKEAQTPEYLLKMEKLIALDKDKTRGVKNISPNELGDNQNSIEIKTEETVQTEENSETKNKDQK